MQIETIHDFEHVLLAVYYMRTVKYNKYHLKKIIIE